MKPSGAYDHLVDVRVEPVPIEQLKGRVTAVMIERQAYVLNLNPRETSNFSTLRSRASCPSLISSPKSTPSTRRRTVLGSFLFEGDAANVRKHFLPNG